MNFLREHQLSIMLFMSGVCAVLVLLVFFTGTLSRKRRRILAMLEAAAMFLLLADRYAYLYRGDPSTKGYWMVRVCNFLVFFLTLYITHCVTLYLYDLFRNEGHMTVLPRRLMICEVLFAAGVLLLVISQFTGLYYTFDDQNRYQRSAGMALSYVVPVLMTLLQQSVVLQYRRVLSRGVWISLLLNTVIPLIASVVQLFFYGVSLTNLSSVGMAIVLYVFALADLSRTVREARQREIEHYKEDQKRAKALFEETAEALTSAIDAKDKYTHGHSARVAMYSQQIAREAGLPEEECEKVYFAALLHDVGKIGIADSIINKDGKLTDEEYAQIKQHPVLGNQILSSIQQSPYLSIGAHYHHERYDGRGYPQGLKGEDIPEIARIIAVADAYDAMASMRSYRASMPQQKVREEILKGMGTQFDPQYAKIMLHLIDLDVEYRMQEQEEGAEFSEATHLHCDALGEQRTTGVLLTEKPTRIRLFTKPDDGAPGAFNIPSLILFDSLDGRVHDTEAKRKDLNYFEYARIRFDGATTAVGVRRQRTQIRSPLPGEAPTHTMAHYKEVEVEGIRVKDHARIRLFTQDQTVEVILALPDSSRFAYLSLTGQHCSIRGIQVRQEEAPVPPGTIPRIAEEISFIRGAPQGDLPNVQIDGWRSAATRGVPVTGSTTLTFHTQSLPTARLVWHCPFVSLYTSQDGQINGEGFREFALIRLDGENWESDAHATNEVQISRAHDFAGWHAWKEQHKQGLDCRVAIHREDNRVTVTTENLGIFIRCVTVINDDVEQVYAALTGDQCALTDIHVVSPSQP